MSDTKKERLSRTQIETEMAGLGIGPADGYQSDVRSFRMQALILTTLLDVREDLAAAEARDKEIMDTLNILRFAR